MTRLRIGYLLPGFSAHADDWAIPAQQTLVAALAAPHDVQVIALRYPHTQQPYMLDGASVHPLGAAQVRGAGRFVLWLRALHLLRRLHHAMPFDVLHATWGDETGALAVWAGRALGVRSVVTLAGGELAHLPAIGYGLQRGAFSRWVVRQALHADAVIAISAWLAERARVHGMPAARLHTLPLPMDTDRFLPAGSPPEPSALLHVGSLLPVKRQAALLHALVHLPAHRLHIVGDGPERAPLAALATQLGVAARVRWHGAVAYADMPARYQQAALHLAASHHEGAMQSVIEAAACGVLTAGAAVGVLPGEPAFGTALDLPADDAAAGRALADAARILLAAPDLPARRAAARVRVLEAYTPSVIVERLTALYQGERPAG
jgi:glycosyltransferase involved in cell wall biosynthesis